MVAADSFKYDVDQVLRAASLLLDRISAVEPNLNTQNDWGQYDDLREHVGVFIEDIEANYEKAIYLAPEQEGDAC